LATLFYRLIYEINQSAILTKKKRALFLPHWLKQRLEVYSIKPI